MRAAGLNAELYLGKLAELGVQLARTRPGSDAFFAGPLHIVQAAMSFTVSVLYRVERVVDRTLVLEIAGMIDPANRRPDLALGARLTLPLDQPAAIFRNETRAFVERGVAAINIPGVGCDIAGYVSAGETAAEAYLLGGDFVGAEAGLLPVDVRAFEIATGLLSALLTKAHFQERADYDRLTGLMSSARIRSELDAALSRCAQSSGESLTVVLADVDEFKHINDRHGHLNGDAVLNDLGRLLSSRLRPGQDHAGRYGGDEFLILLERTAAAEARPILEQIGVAVQQHAFGGQIPASDAVSDRPLPVTISLGACALEASASRPSAIELLALADRALYAAKHAGRNRVVVTRL
jgi:diguanylate cyclase (GGDEF)-like protein